MTSNTVGKLRQIVEAELAPKDSLLGALKDLDTIQVLTAKVLCATYPGSKYQPGSKTILRTDKSLQEAQYQGAVFLVVKAGPCAFKDAPGAAFGGVTAKVGDWIVARPADGQQIAINGVPCRIFDDTNICMVVENPEAYW